MVEMEEEDNDNDDLPECTGPFLPVKSVITERMMTYAIENGLKGVSEDVIEMLHLALNIQLKKIPSALIKSRKNYCTTNFGRFFYDDAPSDIEHEVYRNTGVTGDAYWKRFDCTAACESYRDKIPNERINLNDMFLTLQDLLLIRCSSVYNKNIIRISMALE